MTIASETSVLSPSGLVEFLGLNIHLITIQTKGLTHADSLLQPAPRGNSLNWVLGHILLHREYMLAALSQEPLLGQTALARYARDSDPITADGEGVLPLEELLAALGNAQDRLATALTTASADALTQASPVTPEKSAVEEVHFLMWHETYHVGLTELLRQLSGVNDKVI